jgi:hypothetical protein
MTTFNVHIYREMRLKFEGIEAKTPGAAAVIARDKLTSDADDLQDCEGENLAALIDVVGDEEFSQSVIIDFEAELQRRAAPKLLAALEDLLQQLIGVGIAAESVDDPEFDFGQWAGTEGLFFAKVRTAIAEGKASCMPPSTSTAEKAGQP